MTGMGRPPLWRQGDFAKIWSAATVSAMGSQVTIIALPFLALTMLGASVLQVSLLAAVEMLPFLLFNLPAGAWPDRVRRRPILVAADIARAVTLLSIPAAFVAGALTLWQLYVVAFVTGTLTAFFDIADQSYIPAILHRDDLVDANAHLQISYSVAQIGGPIVGGNIIALIAAPWAIAVDALSFLFSGALIGAIRRSEEKPVRRVDDSGRPASIRSEVAEGLRYVLGHKYLRPIAACTGISCQRRTANDHSYSVGAPRLANRPNPRRPMPGHGKIVGGSCGARRAHRAQPWLGATHSHEDAAPVETRDPDPR